MTGSEAAGEWDLLISNLTMEDDAMFQCQVGATHTQPPIRSRYARVTVLAAPAPPTLSPAPAPALGIVLRQGEAARLECESRGGKPAASISWRINGEAVTAGVEARVTQLPASKKTVTVSSLSLARVARNMSGAVVECEAATSGGREVRAVLGETRATAAASLVVEHPPEVSLSLDSAAAVAEGDTVKVSASKSSIRRFVITEKAPKRLLPLSHLRHYAKQAFTPRSLNVKLGPRRNYHKVRAAIKHYANQTARTL